MFNPEYFRWDEWSTTLSIPNKKYTFTRSLTCHTTSTRLGGSGFTENDDYRGLTFCFPLLVVVYMSIVDSSE